MLIRRLAAPLALAFVLLCAMAPAALAHDGAEHLPPAPGTAPTTPNPLLSTPAPVVASQADSEVIALLRELVRIDTSNPPGNEARVAEFLRARLEPLGFEIDVIPTPAPGKAHFIARLRAASPQGKPILMAGHADVVGVERALWTLDPFQGVVANGFLYGRGALDFKGGLAAFTIAAERLARSGTPLTRDVILLAEADEEGGSYGTPWLAERHWDKLDAEFSLNEGGWLLEDAQGAPRFLGITTIDKNSLSVRLETRGPSTHSSRPGADDALRRLVRALERIGGYETAPAFSATARRHFRSLGRALGGDTNRAVRRLLAAEGAPEGRQALRSASRVPYGRLLNGLSRLLYVPTIVQGGFRSNVLPGTATATVNLRLLPGQQPRPALRELRRAIGDARVRITPIGIGAETAEQTLNRFDVRARQRPSRVNTTLYGALATEARAQWRGITVAPALFEAGTDAGPWRDRGIPVYGIYPYPVGEEDLLRMHGNDERVPVRGLEEGTEMLTRVLRRVATAGG